VDSDTPQEPRGSISVMGCKQVQFLPASIQYLQRHTAGCAEGQTVRLPYNLTDRRRGGSSTAF
jgi:hypothetical protein